MDRRFIVALMRVWIVPAVAASENGSPLRAGIHLPIGAALTVYRFSRAR